MQNVKIQSKNEKCEHREGTLQYSWQNAKHDCSATFQGRAILPWHEANPPAKPWRAGASHYIFCILSCHFNF
jgi:hypothetical protein